MISLFAEDVLIYLNDPVRHFDRPMQKLKIFGDYSGYRLNISKTQTLLFHTIPSPEPTEKPTEQFKDNYDNVNNMIRSDIEHWCTYPMDLTARINIVNGKYSTQTVALIPITSHTSSTNTVYKVGQINI